MYFNNRNNQQVYGYGCSFAGCLLFLILASFLIRGSLFIFFRYFWVILLIGVIVWIFRNVVHSDGNSNEEDQTGKRSNWQRDFENRNDTGYHNVDRDFEEVDEEEEEDEFSDF